MLALLRNRRLLALALGHFGIDLYPNVLPMLYPVFMASMDLSYTLIGILQLAYTLVSSLTQLPLGMLADRVNNRYMAACSVLLIGVFMAFVGFAWDYWSLMAFVCLAGLAVAAYHPQGATNVAATTSAERRATAMSIYMFGGSAGFALGPVVGAAILASPFELRGSVLLPIPSALIGLWLLRLMADVPTRKSQSPRSHSSDGSASARHSLRDISILIWVVLMRSWAFGTLIAFVPLLYASRQLQPGLTSAILMVMLLSSACGSVIGAVVADRFGRKLVVSLAMLVTVPALVLFLNTGTAWAFPVGALAGLAFGGSNAVLLVMAQDMMPRSTGLASGLVLGFAFVTGGIGVAVTGWLADQYGLTTALSTLVVVVLAGLAFSLLLPRAHKPLAAAQPIAPAV